MENELHNNTIKEIAKFICGYEEKYPIKRNIQEIIIFFNNINHFSNSIVITLSYILMNNLNRNNFTEDNIIEIVYSNIKNDKYIIFIIIKELADPRLYRDESVINNAHNLLNEILFYENLKVCFINNVIDITKINQSEEKMKLNTNLLLEILLDLQEEKKIEEKKYNAKELSEHQYYLLDNNYAKGSYFPREDGIKIVKLNMITEKGLNYLEALEIKAKYNLPYTIGENVYNNEINSNAKNKINYSSENEIKVFLSYSSANKEEANKIDKILENENIIVIRDERELKYTDNIKSFEESIRDYNYSIFLISSTFLESDNCLYEVINLFKEKDYQNKILPIIIDINNFGEFIHKKFVVDYWKNKIQIMENELKNSDIDQIIKFSNEIKIIQEINMKIGDFIDTVKNMIYWKYENQNEDNFKQLINKIK